jgi:hypothetical protein
MRGTCSATGSIFGLFSLKQEGIANLGCPSGRFESVYERKLRSRVTTVRYRMVTAMLAGVSGYVRLASVGCLRCILGLAVEHIVAAR